MSGCVCRYVLVTAMYNKYLFEYLLMFENV